MKVLFGVVAAAYAYTTTKAKPKEARMKRTFKFGIGGFAAGLVVDNLIVMLHGMNEQAGPPAITERPSK